VACHSARDCSAREQHTARLAAEYNVESSSGDGRYAAVVRRAGRTELVQGDDINDLLALGELLALVDLGHHRDGSPQAR